MPRCSRLTVAHCPAFNRTSYSCSSAPVILLSEGVPGCSSPSSILPAGCGLVWAIHGESSRSAAKHQEKVTARMKLLAEPELLNRLGRIPALLDSHNATKRQLLYRYSKRISPHRFGCIVFPK